ncbi:LysR family transcriptional regulator [Aurantivibrio infirmus]
MRRLPPLPECIAFEAVATHLSFTHAAEELCLSQSAISHRIRRLENFVGTQLIHRMNPGVELSREGKKLLPDIVAALDALGRIGKNQERCLRVVAGTALCQLWLAPRLMDFMASHPGLTVELIPRDAPDDKLKDIDIWIGWQESTKATNENSSPLFTELVFPVCSPRLLPGGKLLGHENMLVDMPLLHKATNGDGEWSWPVWFQYLNIGERNKAEAQLRFADMGLMVSAAINGAGVALARSLLVHDALKAGTLIVPLSNFEPMRSTKKHIARWSENRNDDTDVDAFKNWLITQAAQTLADTEDLLGKAEGSI